MVDVVGEKTPTTASDGCEAVFGGISEHQQWRRKALGVTLSELFRADEIFTDVKSSDKTLMEKLRLLDTLEDKDKQSLYHIIDTFILRKN
jgi:hypothetical protein